MAPVFTAHKRTLAAHWNVYKRLLLLSSGAALVAYTTSLSCLYPYPIATTEIVTILLKALLLSGAIALAIYCLFVTGGFVCTRLLQGLRLKPAGNAEQPKVQVRPASFTACIKQACP